jgi:hypothetical protein
MKIWRSGTFDCCWSESDALAYDECDVDAFTDLCHRYGRLVDDDRYHIGYNV